MGTSAGPGAGVAARVFALAALGVLASARPVAAQCPDGTPPPCAAQRSPGPAPTSVAVLYFDNVSRDSSDAALADGLTEEIILRLQQVRRLSVRSRFESQRVRARRGVAPAALGRDLAARYLVNGSIQRAGDRIVVRVELTRADRGAGVWSRRFDKRAPDVLDVIDDVARGVATGVAGELLPAEQAELARRPSADPVAYEHLVRGNVYLAQRTPSSLARAVDEYEAAFARDGELKVALGRVAYAWAIGVAYGVGDLPADTVLERAARAAERAMRLAPDVADTWMAAGFRELGLTVMGAGDSLDESLAALERATRLDPASAEAHHQYGQGLTLAGRDSAALAEYRRALALEPGRAVTYEEIAFLLLAAGRPRDASAWSDSALAADPQFVRGYLVRGRSRLLLGDTAGAERDAASAGALARGSDALDARGLRAVVRAARGDSGGARSELVAVSFPSLFGPEWNLLAFGADSTLALIERHLSPTLRCFVLRFPTVAALRGRPRYERLAAACPARVRAP